MVSSVAQYHPDDEALDDWLYIAIWSVTIGHHAIWMVVDYDKTTVVVSFGFGNHLFLLLLGLKA